MFTNFSELNGYREYFLMQKKCETSWICDEKVVFLVMIKIGKVQ